VSEDHSIGGFFEHHRSTLERAGVRFERAPWEGIAFDIDQGVFWLPSWGPEPDADDEARAIARKHWGYFQNEFSFYYGTPAHQLPEPIRRIDFWSSLVDANT
jgi:hypothetical protein